MKVKDTIKGSPISLLLNPSLPLQSNELEGLNTDTCLLWGSFKEGEILPQEIQLGMAGLEVFKTSFLQKRLPRPQSRFLGLAEVFPA